MTTPIPQTPTTPSPSLIPRKRDLTPAGRRLLELLQKVHFGRLENLHVRDGEPVFTPPPKVVLAVRFPGRNDTHPAIDWSDFKLKPAVVELFRRLDAIGDGVIGVLSVHYGLPASAEVDAPPDFLD
jgi:hypothetical protein